MSIGITTEIESVLVNLGSAITAAFDPVKNLEIAVKSSADMISKITELLQSEFNAHNTPAMVNALESKEIEDDKEKIESDVAKNDLSLDQKDAG